MPDIVSPSLSSPNLDVADIPTQIDFPKWDRPAINIPPILQQSQDVFANYPGNDIPVKDFTDIVNTQLTPQKKKDEAASAQINDKLMDGPALEMKRELPFRDFKVSDAIRYKQNDRLWKKLGFNPELPTDIIDAMYDHAETKWESIKNVFPKMWQTASFQFKNYFQEYGDTASAIFGLDSLVNQERFTKQSERIRDLEELYPDYKTDKEVKWWQLLRGDFWEESGPSLGFTLGTIGAALLENVAITAATAGIGEIGEIYNTPRKVFKSLADYYSLKRAYALVKGATGVKRITGSIGAGIDVWRLTNGALAEAAYEGATNSYDYLEQFKEAYIAKNGYAPSDAEMDKAKLAADKMAKATVLWQTPFLMASNAMQFGNIIAPRAIQKIMTMRGAVPYKLAVDGTFKTTVQATGKPITNPLLKGAIGVGKSVKNSVWEGTEESYQALVSKSTADYYHDEIFNKDNQSLLKSLGAGFDYVKSNQGMKEFAAGFGTGAIFQHAARPFHYLARPKIVTDPKTNEIEVKKNWANNILGLGMKDANKQLDKQKLEKIAKVLNATDIETVLKEEGLLSMIKDKQTMFTLAKFLQTNDFFNMQNAQNIHLNKMLYAGLATGKIDLQISKLQQFAQQDFDTLQKFFDLDNSEYATVEDKEKFLHGFRAFTEALSGKATQIEKIYKGEVTKHSDTIDAAAKGHDDALKAYNSHIDEMMKVYGATTPDDLQNKPVTQPEQQKYQDLAMGLVGAKFRFYAVNEGVKASVFAQVGMMEDASRANKIIGELNSGDTVGIKYNYELSKIFDRGYRDERIKELEDKLATVTDESKATVSEQLEAFKKLAKHLNNNFDKGTEIKDERASKLIQRYFYAIQKELNLKDNNSQIESRINDERNEQTENLVNFMALQRKHQENLNLINYLSAKDNFKEYSNNQSEILTNFFSDAIDAHKDPVQPTPPAAAPPTGPVAPPPAAPTAPTATPPAPVAPIAPQAPSNSTMPSANEAAVMKALMIAIRDNDQAEVDRLSQIAKGFPVDVVLNYRDSYTGGVLGKSFPADKINAVIAEILAEQPVVITPESMAVEAIKAIDLSATSLAVQGKVINDPNSSWADKNTALKEISDQLLSPGTAEQTGTILGRDASEAVENLGYPAPVESGSNYSEVESTVQGVPGHTDKLKQRFIEDIEKRRQQELGSLTPLGENIIPSKESQDVVNAKYDAELAALESNVKTTPNTTKADIERRRQEELNQKTDAGYSTIALDYLFTGGRDVILSTDYLLQALVGGFTNAATEINNIRNKYADKLGNIKDDINSDIYNQMMLEIRDAINKNYNDSKATEIFDKILKNATGFTYREGNQTSIELDKLNEQNESKINAKYDAELKALEQQPISNQSEIEAKKADIERRRQEEIDNLFSQTQASTDKQLNTPVQKLSKEEINRNIETAKQQNKDLIEELEKEFKENTDNKASDEVWDKWDKKSDKLDNNLPQGVSFKITDGKVDLFDNQSYRESNFGGNKITQVSVASLHRQTEKFEVGDRIQVQDGVRVLPAEVTKVNENGKILEAKTDDGRTIISKGNIVTTAPINDRLKINAKYDAELAALDNLEGTEENGSLQQGLNVIDGQSQEHFDKLNEEAKNKSKDDIDDDFDNAITC